METIYTIFATFAALIGLVVGSFLNVCIARLPVYRSVIPRSACPHCGTGIAWYDNIPVVSWVILRGACRTCQGKISPGYPLVELLMGCLALLLFLRIVPDAAALNAAHLSAWVVYLGFFGALVVACYSDIRHRIIPDETSLYAIPVALLCAALLDQLGYTGWPAPGLRQAIWGVALGGGFLGATGMAARLVYGPDALGMGDIKLVAAIGGFLGALPAVIAVLLGASLLGAATGLVALLWARKRVYAPFGPALATASIVYVLIGDTLLPRWLPGLAMWLRDVG